jgi:hypothetical protein
MRDDTGRRGQATETTLSGLRRAGMSTTTVDPHMA